MVPSQVGTLLYPQPVVNENVGQGRFYGRSLCFHRLAITGTAVVVVEIE